MSAFAMYPPRSTPHALHQIESPGFSQPVPFELRLLPVYGFKISASLADLAHPTPPGPSPHPAGGYPNICALTSTRSIVMVEADRPVEGIDIVLYERGGATDPCRSEPAGSCPAMGQASVEVQVKSTRTKDSLGAADQLVFGLFTAFPGPPTRAKTIPSAQLSFPYTIVDNEVTPGDYVVYVCLDVGGNNAMACGPEDSQLFYMDRAKVSLAPNRITTLEMDLDARSSRLVGAVEKQARGCP